MVQVAFSPQARSDLLAITDYLIDIAGPQTARKYETQIRRVIENLSDLPSTGSPRSAFGPKVRLLIVKPYLIFTKTRQYLGPSKYFESFMAAAISHRIC